MVRRLRQSQKTEEERAKKEKKLRKHRARSSQGQIDSLESSVQSSEQVNTMQQFSVLVMEMERLSTELGEGTAARKLNAISAKVCQLQIQYAALRASSETNKQVEKLKPELAKKEKILECQNGIRE